jgi:hypothetical protein
MFRSIAFFSVQTESEYDSILQITLDNLFSP